MQSGGLPLFQNVSATFGRGEMVALTGRSGAAKTTFARLILHYLRPQLGEVRLCVHPRDIVLCAQDTSVLFDRTVGANMLYGSDDEVQDTERLHSMVMETGLWRVFAAPADEDLDRHDNRLAFLRRPVGPNGGRLSGGQRQIVHMVRCLLRAGADARAGGKGLVILDEPTSSLDIETRNIVLELVARLRREMSSTVIVVTHDEEVARLCARRVQFPLARSSLKCTRPDRSTKKKKVDSL
jgi:ABC-type multidrug transport system fused ATPase/permease subunit